MINPNEGQWLTYSEAGQLLGISSEAARQLARRRGWPRRTPNEHNAPARVLVPEDADVRPVVRSQPGLSGGQPPYVRRSDGVQEREVPGLDRADTESAVRAVEAATALLARQLEREQGRADRAERLFEEERQRADRAERHLEEERGHVDEERQRVDELREALADAVAAERIAAGEAAGLRTELDALRKRRRWFRW